MFQDGDGTQTKIMVRNIVAFRDPAGFQPCKLPVESSGGSEKGQVLVGTKYKRIKYQHGQTHHVVCFEGKSRQLYALIGELSWRFDSDLLQAYCIVQGRNFLTSIHSCVTAYVRMYVYIFEQCFFFSH